MCDVMISCLLSITDNLFIFILKILCKWGWLGEHSLPHRPITWCCNSLQELWKPIAELSFSLEMNDAIGTTWTSHFEVSLNANRYHLPKMLCDSPEVKNSSTMWRYHPLVICWTYFALHWNEVGAVIQLLSLVWGKGRTKETGRG